MRDRYYVRFAVSATIILLLVFISSSVSAAKNSKKSDSKSPSYAKDRVIVKFKGLDQCTDCLTADTQQSRNPTAKKFSSVHALHKKHKIKKIRSLFFEKEGLDIAAARMEEDKSRKRSSVFFSKRYSRAREKTRPELSSVFVVELPETTDIETIIREYQMDPNVEYAQPDYFMQTNFLPNDPLLLNLWGLDRVQAQSAWDIAQGEGVIVAVVDTGVDVGHEDLAANIWENAGEIPNNGLDDDNNGYEDDVRGWDFTRCSQFTIFGDCGVSKSRDNDPSDGHGHGTHVAGTIAAVGNNGMGIIGVAPKAKIMPVKGLSDQGGGYMSDLADGIRYAALNGADVINNSWGCRFCPSNPVAEDAVKEAYGLGAVVVFAAGNSNMDAAYFSPQNMKETLTVAASTSTGEKASFSNYGAIIDVMAPGVGILSTVPKSAVISDPTGYMSLSGTSMAAPHVSGLAALVISSHPLFSNEEVRQAIRFSAEDVFNPGFDTKSGHGHINALEALKVDSVLQTLITEPKTNMFLDNVANNILSVAGTAKGPNFQDYSLEYKSLLDQDPWHFLHGPISGSVDNGLLGEVFSSNFEEGTPYLLRLVSNSSDGRKFDDVAPIIMGHDSPYIRLFNDIPILGTNSAVLSIDISGDWAVWMESNIWTGNYWHMHNMKTNERKAINSGANFSVYENKLIAHGVIMNNFASENLVTYNMDTGEIKEYVMELPPPIIGQPKYLYEIFALDNKVVGTLYRENGFREVFFYDMVKGGKLQQISSDTEHDKSSPRIAGNSIVWKEKWPDVGGGVSYKLIRHDMMTGQKTTLASNLLLISTYSIWKDLIVWQDPDTLDFVVYNTTTGKKEIVPGLTNGLAHPLAYQITVSANRIVWCSGPFWFYQQVFEYNLVTQKKKTVKFVPDMIEDLRVSGDRTLWAYRFITSVDDPPAKTPKFDTVEDKIITEGQLLEFKVRATDENGDSLSFTHPLTDELPLGASFQTTLSQAGVIEGVFRFTPVANQVGKLPIAFEVSDSSLYDSEWMTITVEKNTRNRLKNISNRGKVGTGTDVLISGFIIDGGPKKVYIEALGPTLSAFGVPGVLPDPKIQLYFGPTVIAQNDNWQTQSACSAPATCGSVADIQAAGRTPCTVAGSNPATCTKESALLVTLPPGAYTVKTSGVGTINTGVALPSVNDLDPAGTSSRLKNISGRGRIETGANVMISGFIIDGGPKKVYIEALGPTLSAFGVPGVLPDPKIQLYSGPTVIAQNDNWQTQSACSAPATCGSVADIQAAGRTPCTVTGNNPATCTKESALLVTLPPGAYTVKTSGVGTINTGVALSSVNDLDKQ